MYSKKIPYNRYPGDGYYYVICDICGRKVRYKDTMLIKDKYNFQNGLVVCLRDVDKTNPQAYLRARKERPNPKITRGEGPDVLGTVVDLDNYAMYFYVDYDNLTSSMTVLYSEDGNGNFEIDVGTAVVPPEYEAQAPQFIQPVDVTSSTATFLWGGLDTYYFSLDGWYIERNSGSGWTVISTSTGTTAPYYKDTGLSASTSYSYRVGGVNAAGVGPPSPVLTITTSAS